MRYGYFDDEHREYVITRPDTPLPWINYPGLQAYFGSIPIQPGDTLHRDARPDASRATGTTTCPLISAGAMSMSGITSPRLLVSFVVAHPIRFDDYSCRHGMGYTTIASSKNGVEVSTCYFVPLDQNLEVWQVR